MTTTESNITKDMTPIEAANLLAKLDEGHQAAWLSTREAQWHSAEYKARFQNGAEVDGVFRDIMRETVENGMRRPGEPIEEFAERAGSEAWLASSARKACAEPPVHPVIDTRSSRDRHLSPAHRAGQEGMRDDSRAVPADQIRRALSHEPEKELEP